MAKIEVRHLDFINDENFIKVENKIVIFKKEFKKEIHDFELNSINISAKVNGDLFEIYLDKSTAIKFAKTLRTEINKITELKGGQNGRG